MIFDKILGLKLHNIGSTEDSGENTPKTKMVFDMCPMIGHQFRVSPIFRRTHRMGYNGYINECLETFGNNTG